jgi:hypothetical protein
MKANEADTFFASGLDCGGFSFFLFRGILVGVFVLLRL